MSIEQQHRSSIPDNPSRDSDFDYDVAIAGAGISGATLAAALKDSGLRVALIDPQPQSIVAARQQVYAITLLSGDIFQAIGVWDKILPKITAFKEIRLSDADYPGIVQFLPKDLGRERLGYAAEHETLLSALQEFLKECSHITWICPAEVTNVDYQKDGAVIETRSIPSAPGLVAESSSTEIATEVGTELGTQLETKVGRFRVRLLVAADGKKSAIRKAAGISTKGWKYWQSCITTKVKPEKPHQNTAYERFWPSGPFAILPLTGNRCNIVWTAPHAEAKALAGLDDANFLKELKKRYGDRMGNLELLGPRFVFPVQVMQSDRYVKPRLALIGDAAHCCHPVGGQGLNLGIRDAGAIAQVLTVAHQQGEDIGSQAVLERYERWRQLENLTILGFTDFLDRMFSNNWLPATIVRRLGLSVMQNLAPIKKYFLRLMTGQTGRHPELVRQLVGERSVVNRSEP